MSGAPRKKFATRAVHSAPIANGRGGRPIVTPIVQSASFEFDDAADLAASLEDPGSGFSYSRLGNPTVDVLERTVADLEEAEAAVAFGSGMAAIHAAAIAMCGAGDHIVAPASLYGGTFTLFRDVLTRLGVETSFVNGSDPGAVEKALRPNTRMVYAEAIGNPALAVADVPALASVARGAGAKLVVDATFASPYLFRPLDSGADLSVHSATKYLGGHGDVLGGVVSGSEELVRRVRQVLIDVGGVLEPFTAWLILRGIKTLPLRMERHCASARRLAERLERHPGVTRVVYPGLPSHPDHALARRLLPGGQGGMVAIEVPGGRESAAAVLRRLELFRIAGSLGDAHSLALQPAASSHRQFSAKELEKAGIAEGLIRLSIGLEDPEDLMADLNRALGE